MQLQLQEVSRHHLEVSLQLLSRQLPLSKLELQSKMTKNGFYYYVVCTIVAFCLCSGASKQQMSSIGGNKNSNIVSVSLQAKSGGSGASCSVKQKKAPTSTTTTKAGERNIQETFFTKMTEHNTEAFTLLNQLWHSKSGWQHVNTKDGKPTCLHIA